MSYVILIAKILLDPLDIAYPCRKHGHLLSIVKVIS
jgi:hypothetical protein